MKKADVAEVLKKTVDRLIGLAEENERMARSSRHSDREKDAMYHDGLAQGYRLAAIECGEKFSSLTR